MSKPCAAASKELLQLDPAAWAGFVRVVYPPGRVKLTESDLSAVTAAPPFLIPGTAGVPSAKPTTFQLQRGNPAALRAILRLAAGRPRS